MFIAKKLLYCTWIYRYFHFRFEQNSLRSRRQTHTRVFFFKVTLKVTRQDIVVEYSKNDEPKTGLEYLSSCDGSRLARVGACAKQVRQEGKWKSKRSRLWKTRSSYCKIYITPGSESERKSLENNSSQTRSSICPNLSHGSYAKCPILSRLYKNTLLLYIRSYYVTVQQRHFIS